RLPPRWASVSQSIPRTFAKKANEIAPGRFTWRKYKDQINLAVKALEAAEPRKVVGQDRLRQQRERARLLGTEAYAKIAGDRAQDLTRRDAESFFRVDTYAHGEARRRRKAMIANAHG